MCISKTRSPFHLRTVKNNLLSPSFQNSIHRPLLSKRHIRPHGPKGCRFLKKLNLEKARLKSGSLHRCLQMPEGRVHTGWSQALYYGDCCQDTEQWAPIGTQEASIWTRRNAPLLSRWQNTETGYPENSSVTLLFISLPTSVWTWLWTACCSKLCLGRAWTSWHQSAPANLSQPLAMWSKRGRKPWSCETVLKDVTQASSPSFSAQTVQRKVKV